MKLKTKVNLFSTLLTLIILIGSFTGIYFLYKELAFSTEAKQLQERANELSTAVSSLTTTNGIDTIFRAYIPTDGAIIVRNVSGKNLIHMQMTSQQIEFEVDRDEHYTKKIIGDIPYIAFTTPLIWPDQQIVEAKLIQPLPTITENLNRLMIILMLMTLLAIVPMYLASQLLVRLIVKPVQRLTTTMKKNIHDSSFEQLPVKKSSKDEIAQMTTTYNHLMAQLEDVHDKQQQFVGNASHELKTPLTVIESYANLLKRRGTFHLQNPRHHTPQQLLALSESCFDQLYQGDTPPRRHQFRGYLPRTRRSVLGLSQSYPRLRHGRHPQGQRPI